MKTEKTVLSPGDTDLYFLDSPPPYPSALIQVAAEAAGAAAPDPTAQLALPTGAHKGAGIQCG